MPHLLLSSNSEEFVNNKERDRDPNATSISVLLLQTVCVVSCLVDGYSSMIGRDGQKIDVVESVVKREEKYK